MKKIEARRIEAGRIDAGRIETGSIEAGRIETGSIDAGSIEAAGMKLFDLCDDRVGEKGGGGDGGVKKKCILGVGQGGGKCYGDFSCGFRIV